MKQDKLLIFIENELAISEYVKKAIQGKFKNPSSNVYSISGVTRMILINDPMRFIKLQVKTILENYPATADDNSILCRLFYKINYGIEKDTTVSEFFDRIVNKEMPSIETICRVSRQIQEKNVNLRGENWKERQRKIEKVKNDLGYKLKNKL